MKKAKFMLLSLALVAVVGGALAFKAKVDTKFCTTIAFQYEPGKFTCQDLTCPNLTTGVTTNGGISPTVYCTTEDVNEQCPGNLACEITTRQTKVGDQ